MAHDWYRKTSWTPADEEDFHKRLSRARDGGRQQYLRIQAWYLMEQGERYYPPALALLDTLLSRYPDHFNLGCALATKAECLDRMGDTQGALTFYDRAVDYARAHRNLGSLAWLDLPLLVARERLSVRYRSALALLDEFGAVQPFPSMVFKSSTARALILSDCGLDQEAADAAHGAMAAAEQKTSGLSRHPKVGLVGERHHNLLKQLQEIIGGATRNDLALRPEPQRGDRARSDGASGRNPGKKVQ